mgnify:CR=1 FL=1
MIVCGSRLLSTTSVEWNAARASCERAASRPACSLTLSGSLFLLAKEGEGMRSPRVTVCLYLNRCAAYRSAALSVRHDTCHARGCLFPIVDWLRPLKHHNQNTSGDIVFSLITVITLFSRGAIVTERRLCALTTGSTASVVPYTCGC